MKIILNLFNKHKHYILPTAFIFGFIFDYLTLTRIDRVYDNLVLLGYITIAALGIIFVYSNLSSKFLNYLRAFTPTIIQFAFGGLFSGFFVFYSRSASLAASWPFLLLLIGLLVGNEFFKERYSRLTFQLTVFFFVLFSYLIFLLPVLIGRMGSLIFLASGIASLLVMSLFVRLLKIINKQKIEWGRTYLTLSIGGIFLAVNILYFTNILPPIPLSLKEIGVYYSVERTAEGEYRLQSIPQSWYSFLQKYKRVPSTSQPLYVFSSVFAPTDLQTNIVHHWQYYDEQKDKWISALKINFPAFGGSDGGYRGFSQKELILPGYWRVDIETPNGLLIGRIRFLVK